MEPVAGRASIVGAAATHVGKVRDHNEDSHFVDEASGLFLVCDGMGGHAAGEVASALAVQTIRGRWLEAETQRAAEAWLQLGTAQAKKQMFGAIREGVVAAHDRILAEGAEDDAKSGMGTTLVGALLIGNELVFAHAGDSRAYLVRDGIAMQLTEDHTLLARLLAAGIDVDVSGEGARFRSMLTNALGIGQECKVATFVVPLADGDRFLLCSDGISEYVPEAEVGIVLTERPSPASAAARLVELALDRGGGDNATALVIGVIEAGVTAWPAEHRRRDDEVIQRCPLWGQKLTPQQRLRALRIAIPREHAAGERVPAHTLGDRVAWIVVEGTLDQDGRSHGPGALVYPESLLSDSPAPDRDSLAVARTDVRVLALRADDFRELCDDDTELGEALLETLGSLVTGRRRPGRVTRESERADTVIDRRAPSNSDVIEPPPPVMEPLPIVSRPSPPGRYAATVPAQPPPGQPPSSQAKAQAARLPAQPPARPTPLPAALQGQRAGSRTAPPPPPGSPQRAGSRTAPPATQPVTQSVQQVVQQQQQAEPAPARRGPAEPAPLPRAASEPAPRPRTPSEPAIQPRAASAPAPRPRAPTDQPTVLERPAKPTPLPSATSFARASSPRPTGPQHPREPTPGPAGLQARPSGPSFARPVTPPPPLASSAVVARPGRSTPQPAVPPAPGARHESDPGSITTPRAPILPVLPEEPEIETYYEMEAEPPPLPAPPSPTDDDDDPIAEMTVLMDDGSERVTETMTAAADMTVTVTVTEKTGPIDSEPTKIRAITADDTVQQTSGSIMLEDDDSAPAPRPPSRIRRASDSWDE